MVRNATYPQHSRQRPDPIRIVAISGAIAANIALFGFLMQPPSFAPPVDDADHSIPISIVPKPDPKPVVVEVQKKPPTHTVTTTTVKLAPPPPQPPRVIVDTTDPMTQPMQPDQPLSIDSGKVDIQPPLAPVETSLTPIASPAPTYPRDALRDNVTGTVELELVVGTDGRVIEARLLHSSGDHRLDVAAREQVLRNWRFQPAMRNGVAVEALGHLPVVFTLDGQ